MEPSVPKSRWRREPHALALQGDTGRGIKWGLWGSAPATLKGPFVLQTTANPKLRIKNFQC